jgi:hypothetical protein
LLAGMHLYSQLIQAETGDVIKLSVGCNQVVSATRGRIGQVSQPERR